MLGPVLKRMIVAGVVVGAFLVAPPAIAKSSATVPAKAPVAKAQVGHHDGQCPSARTATTLDF